MPTLRMGGVWPHQPVVMVWTLAEENHPRLFEWKPSELEAVQNVFGVFGWITPGDPASQGLLTRRGAIPRASGRQKWPDVFNIVHSRVFRRYVG
ncbi:hypothetical protein FOPE_12691 [Fonsecaea pedrosoi]|nr:hypothetical protein FOPE_12691 [Fonsecaea pedrosoi]